MIEYSKEKMLILCLQFMNFFSNINIINISTYICIYKGFENKLIARSNFCLKKKSR